MNAERPNGCVPSVISLGTAELKPLLELWREKHPDVPWAVLIRRALKKELAPLAGKRLAHLVAERAA